MLKKREHVNINNLYNMVINYLFVEEHLLDRTQNRISLGLNFKNLRTTTDNLTKLG